MPHELDSKQDRPTYNLPYNKSTTIALGDDAFLRTPF